MEEPELRKWVEDKSDILGDGLRAGVDAIKTGVGYVFDLPFQGLDERVARDSAVTAQLAKQRAADSAYLGEFTDKAVADFHERLTHIRHPFEPAMPPAVNGLRGAVNGTKVKPEGLEPVRIPSAMAVRG